MCLILIFLVFSISISYALIPQITLNGKSNITLELNDKYKDSGVNVRNVFGNTNYKIITKGKINNNKIGKYKIKYLLSKKISIGSHERKINIIDKISPEINLIGGETVSVCPNKEYEELGYNCIDNYDKDITKKVKISKSKNVIKYKYIDSSGNITIKKRNLIYEDKTIPDITLSGDDNIIIYRYSKYNEPGYSAIDNCDGNITDKVIVSGNVDTNNLGTYKLTYTVNDSNGNVTTKERIINVIQPKYVSPDGNSTIYLTFDDGPSSSVTSKILDILKEENVKATFFVINRSDNLDYLIKREYDEGHTVGLHSYTHRYDIVYSSLDAYFNDLYSISNKVKNIIGEESKIIRFPGGSSNTISKNYSNGIMSILANEVGNRGFTYFDWNVSSSDAGGAKSSNDVYNNVVKNLYKNRANIVLMHDFENNYKTLDALRDIIRYGKSNGYNFDRLNTSSPQAKQRINN